MSNENKQAVWVSNETHRRLKKYCEQHGLKISYIVEKVIKDKLENEAETNA
tara:strand:+ start:1643 stop:1795 length:153 start_codon:yes stop_codon:yes gene_type:complete